MSSGSRLANRQRAELASIRGLLTLALVAWASSAAAQQQSVLATRHNLSVSGPGEIRSLTETEVCKFCHIPHNAVEPVPLWGHELSRARYDVPEIATRAGREPAPQPDGSSRLCLSCHDGTIALGDVAGEARPLPVSFGERLNPGRSGFLGTDLSGSHPISFKVPDGDTVALDPDTDLALRPLALIREDPDVRLDGQGKMQCTTCHEAHTDAYYQPGRVPRFWVKATVEGVCLTCHVLR